MDTRVVAITMAGKNADNIQVFDKQLSAVRSGNGYAIYTSVQELIKDRRAVSDDDLLRLYNLHAPKAMKALASREERAKKLWELAMSGKFGVRSQPAVHPNGGKPEHQGETDMATKTKKATKKAAKKSATKGESGPRKTMYDGKKLAASKDHGDLSPLREGSARQAPFNYILKHPGCSYEDYAKAGHPSNVLRVLVDQKRVVVK